MFQQGRPGFQICFQGKSARGIRLLRFEQNCLRTWISACLAILIFFKYFTDRTPEQEGSDVSPLLSLTSQITWSNHLTPLSLHKIRIIVPDFSFPPHRDRYSQCFGKKMLINKSSLNFSEAAEMCKVTWQQAAGSASFALDHLGIYVKFFIMLYLYSQTSCLLITELRLTSFSISARW